MANKTTTFTINIDARIQDIVSKMNTVKGVVQNTFNASNLGQSLQGNFNALEKIMKRIKNTTTSPIRSEWGVETLLADFKRAGLEVDEVRKKIESFQNAATLKDKVVILGKEQVKAVEDIDKILTSINTKEEQRLKTEEKIAELKKESYNITRRKGYKESTTKLANAQEEYNALAEAQKAAEEKLSNLGSSFTLTKTKSRIKGTALNSEKILDKFKGFYSATGDYKSNLTQLFGEGWEKRSGLIDQETGLLKLGMGNGSIGQKLKQELTNGDFPNEKIQEAITLFQELIKQKNEYLSATTDKANADAALGASTEKIKNIKNDLKPALDRLKEIQTELTELEKKKNIKVLPDNMVEQLKEVAKNAGYSEEEIQKLVDGLGDNPSVEQFKQALEGINIELGEKATASYENATNGVELYDAALREANADVNAQYESEKQLNDQMANVNAITNRIKMFTGFYGIMNLVRRSINSAISTIKELDEQMTKMAVVTSPTISDYWKQLPQYTKRANALGAAIKEVYEADTLYYQQGLKTNQVIAVSNETMKMARIAALDAAEATDRMTSAMRGFNMEINETSAQRVNDVYSQLAAITASDVNEISVAMTKTASIAHSAGMEFETTAAFLSQIIETTRESADTAGTALKTIIARFEELKKSPTEIGEVDGEVVDANKIETALRSVGIALRDSKGQFRDLDDVFLELSSKWDSLDKNTQRYIATIAAGSRQQSRFIAMMQNYSHTVDLVAKANGSAGASQKQFEKTLDSMKTKLNALKNAWDTFTMGILDSDFLKSLVSLGTTFVDVFNKIGKAIDSLNVYMLGSVTRVGMLIVGMRTLGKVARTAIPYLVGKGSIGNIIGKGTLAASAVGANQKMGLIQALANRGAVRNYLKEYGGKGVGAARLKENANANLLSVEGITNVKSGLVSILPTLLKISAIVGVIVVLFQGLKSLEDQEKYISKEEVLKRDKEALDRYNESLKQSQEILNSTKEERDLYRTAKEELSKLVVGTDAWKEKISQVNQQVIDLVLKYKELAKYTQTNLTTGELSINAEGWEALLQKQNEEIYKNSLKVISQQRRVDKASTAELYSSLSNEFGAGLINQLRDKTTQELKNILLDENEVEKLQQALGTSDSSIISATKAIYEQKTMTEANSTALDLLTKEMQKESGGKNGAPAAYISYLQENASYDTLAKQIRDSDTDEDKLKAYLRYKGYDSKEISGLNTKELWAAATGIASGIEDLYEAIDKFKEDMDFSESGAIMQFGRRAVDTIFSLDQVITGDYDPWENLDYAPQRTSSSSLIARDWTKGLIADAALEGKYNDEWEEYKKDFPLVAKYLEEGPEKLSNEEWKLLKQDEKQLEELNKVVKKLDNAVSIEEKIAQAEANGINKKFLYNRMNLSEGNAKTISPIDRLNAGQYDHMFAEKSLEEALGKMLNGESIENVPTAEDYKVINKLILGIYEDSLGEVKENYSKTIEDLFNETDSIGKDVQARLGGVLNTIFTQTGIDGAEKFAQSFNQIFIGLAEEDRQKFVEILTSDNVSDTGALEKIKKSLIETFKESSYSIENFINLISELTKATKKINFDVLINAMDKLGSTIANIKEGKFEGYVTEDEKTILETYGGLEGKFATTLGGIIATATEDEIMEAFQKIMSSEELKLDLSTAEKASKTNFQYSKEEITDMVDAQSYSLYESVKKLVNSMGLTEEEQERLGLNGENIETDFSLLGNIYNSLRELGANYIENSKKTEYLQNRIYEATQDWGQNYAGSLKGDPASMLAVMGQLERNGLDETNRPAYERYKEFYNKRKKGQLLSKEEMAELETLTNFFTKRSSYQEATEDISAFLSTAKDSIDTIKEAGVQTELSYNELSKALNKVGVNFKDITAENAEMYAGLLDEVVNGNYDAFKALAEMVLITNGYTMEELNLITSNAMSELDLYHQKAASMLQNLGFGFYKDGMFSLLSPEDFLAQVNKANGKDKDKEVDPWENPYDWLWNITEQINKALYQRERLERKYKLAVDDTLKSTEDLYEVSKKELSNLEEQARLQSLKGQKATEEAQLLLSHYKEYAKYVSMNPLTGQVQVAYEDLDKKNWSQEQGSAFESFVSKLTELAGEIKESNKSLEEIEDEVKEIQNRGREELINLQNRVKDALVTERQREIDTLQEVNDAISNQQSKLLEAMQQQIDETRRIRENTDKQEEIEKKRQRLSYLQRDTSGANQTEILSLQEEIENDTISYQDSLIDQSLQKMQEDNELAAEKRQEQIDIMNNQLARWTESGEIWNDVGPLLNDYFADEEKSDLKNILSSAEGWQALSELEKEDLEEELYNSGKLAELFNKKELYQAADGTLTEVKKYSDTLQSKLNSAGVLGNKILDNGEHLKVTLKDFNPKESANNISNKLGSGVGLLQNIWNKFKDMSVQQGVQSLNKAGTNLLGSSLAQNLSESDREKLKTDWENSKADFVKTATTYSMYSSKEDAINDFKNIANDPELSTIVQNFYANNKDYFAEQMAQLYNSIFKKGWKFANGGLATKTGPAWLDGTPSKPEPVLNAEQGRAFYTLVDGVSTLLNSANQGGTGGDNYFNVTVNVDEIANDYDVDKAIARIKQSIIEDSNYRNVNFISGFTY